IEHIEDYPDNTVGIYNRWGSVVWEEKGYNNSTVAWKGNDSRGNALAPGTYFFIVEISGGKTTGWVELMR
ncbi:MAG: T9SS type B sorting domain-containing protein, partial [Bacteroidia bacterium]